MPIHLFWGDDISSRNKAVEDLVKKVVNPIWSSINVSRINGENVEQLERGLSEMCSPPMGDGHRVVIIQNSKFFNSVANELTKKFEENIPITPSKTTLILNNFQKPDKRLKTTKTIDILIKQKTIYEKKFILPTIWDIKGQQNLVEKIASSMNIAIEKDAVNALINSTSNDSSQIVSELKKISLYNEAQRNFNNNKESIISLKQTLDIVSGGKTNVFQVIESLINEKYGEAIKKIVLLIDNGEPPLRILASLVSQIRPLLWVSLFKNQNETNIEKISKVMGINNPKRIYILRKQIENKPYTLFLKIQSQLLEVEISLKKGKKGVDAFKDVFLNTG